LTLGALEGELRLHPLRGALRARPLVLWDIAVPKAANQPQLSLHRLGPLLRAAASPAAEPRRAVLADARREVILADRLRAELLEPGLGAAQDGRVVREDCRLVVARAGSWLL
jgi:hypothetical protein